VLPLFNLKRIEQTLRIAKQTDFRRRPILRPIQPVGIKETDWEGGMDWHVSIEILQGFVFLNEILERMWEESPWPISDFRFSECWSGNYSLGFSLSHSQMRAMWERIYWAEEKRYLAPNTEYEEAYYAQILGQEGEAKKLSVWAWDVEWAEFMPQAFIKRQEENYAARLQQPQENDWIDADLLFMRFVVEDLRGR